MPIYKGSKVLVTGGTGFLGTHLVAALLVAGAEVRTVGRRARPCHLAPEVEYLKGDLLDAETRTRSLRGIELVFNLAAVGWGLHENLRRQADLLTGNILLNTLMLDAAFKAGISGYLYTSSSAVYPGYLEQLDEDAPWDAPPHGSEAAFGWAKRIGELQARVYFENHKLPIAIVRPANPYGPWDNFDPERSHVIPALIRRALAREDPFVVWSSGAPLRSFVYASDAAEMMMLALERCADCRPINIASPELVSIAELVRMVLVAGNHHRARVAFDANKPDGHPRKVPSLRRAAEALGKTDYIPLRDGLARTVEWYRRTITQSVRNP